MTTRPAAFDERLHAYMPALKKLAVKLSDRGGAEDLIQDTLLYVLTHWTKFRGDPSAPKSGFYNWLTLNMRSLAQNKRRSIACREAAAPMVGEEKAVNVGTMPNQDDAAFLGQVSRRLKQTREGRALYRYALGDTLEEIGRRRGVGRERARQLVMAGRERIAKMAA